MRICTMGVGRMAKQWLGRQMVEIRMPAKVSIVTIASPLFFRLPALILLNRVQFQT